MVFWTRKYNVFDIDRPERLTKENDNAALVNAYIASRAQFKSIIWALRWKKSFGMMRKRKQTERGNPPQ